MTQKNENVRLADQEPEDEKQQAGYFFNLSSSNYLSKHAKNKWAIGISLFKKIPTHIPFKELKNKNSRRFCNRNQTKILKYFFLIVVVA